MMNRIKYIVMICFACGIAHDIFAQTAPRKFTFTGAARGYFLGDRLDQDLALEDTVTVPRLNSGHVMADLGLNIRPNKNMEILGMVRVRNDYGGFWGAGVTFDVRQMYIKGIIGGVVRYQLGDINYRMTPYTFWNNDQEFLNVTPTIFRQQFDVVNYDHFHDQDNSWRQQGGAAEWGLVFSRYIKELQFHTVATRVRASNNSTQNDRIFAGGNVQMIQSKYFDLGVNYMNLIDVEGTSRNTSLYRNPVLTATARGLWSNKDWNVVAQTEVGNSKTLFLNNEEAPEREGSFSELKANVQHVKSGFSFEGIVKRVDSEFSSPGAQTKRINFNAQPRAFERIGNEQTLRPFSVMDLMRESSMYNMQLQPYLMNFVPRYDNITPFGAATPNRQGFIGKVAWQDKKKEFNVSFEQMMLSETRGEGTPEARTFTRSEVIAKWGREQFSKVFQKRLMVEAFLRLDNTSRPGTDAYRGVDLSTNVAGIGAEIELVEKLDLIAGWQWIEYSGFDYTAVRDQYATIFNFNEYSVNGKEVMRAAGLRYRFSEKSFLSVQWNNFSVQDASLAQTNLVLDQFMLLYNIKF